MRHHQLPFLVVFMLGIVDTTQHSASAQTQVQPAMQANVEYQYQMYFPRFWGGGWGGGYGGYGGYGAGYGGYGGGYGAYGGWGGGYGGWGWGGPGLSLGGSLPANSREGISSLYGFPFPPPLGAGVYMNPFGYAARLPGPNEIGLASSSPGALNTRQGGTPTVAPAQNIAGARQPPTTRPKPSKARVSKARANLMQSTSLKKNVADVDGGADEQQIVSTRSELDLANLQHAADMETHGDVNLLNQQWTQAYINYRNAVMISDRPDAHVRFGFASALLHRYAEAVEEFKVGIDLDPATVNSGPMLENLLGAENIDIRTDLIHSVARWAQEDLNDQDRLFLLGLLLRSNRDGRSTEIIEAAMRLPGPDDHLAILLVPPVEPAISVPSTPPLEPSKPTPDPPPVVRRDSHGLPELRQSPMPLAFHGPGK